MLNHNSVIAYSYLSHRNVIAKQTYKTQKNTIFYMLYGSQTSDSLAVFSLTIFAL